MRHVLHVVVVFQRIEYAQVLVKLNDPHAAAEQLRLALRTNDQYDPTEPKRLSNDRVKQLGDMIQRLDPPAGGITR